MDERVLTEHSGGPDSDSFPAVTGEHPGAAGPPAAPDTAAAAAAAASPAASAPSAAAPAPTSGAPPATLASRWYQLPYALVLAVVAAGLFWTWQGTVRAGMVTVAAGLLAAALARLVLPERRAGLLVTRHRLFDVVTLLGLGVCILVVALVLPRSAVSPV